MDSKRLGKCYQLAGRYAFDHQSAILVHGSIQGFDHPRLKHAFCLTETGVYEPVTDQIWELDLFCSWFSPWVDNEYTQREVFTATLIAQNWGPWE